MTIKGNNTRNLILDESYKLFAQKGFNAVTMKDICEASALSRGGLYSHFGSTQEIFEALLGRMDDSNEDDYAPGIKTGESAVKVLCDALELMRQEMLSKEDSLSLAFFEYAQSCNGNAASDFAENGRKTWIEIIEYGIKTGEFNDVDSEEISNLLMYAYQGVRMWSRIIDIKQKEIDGIIDNIKRQVIKDQL